MELDQKQLKIEASRGRRFGILPILDGYVLREFLIPFSVLAFTFTLLFLIGDLFNDLSDFLEYKGPGAFRLACRYFTLKMPGNIRFVLPISVLLSCMYTVANLGRCREITAMRASGISMIRCGGSIFAAAFCVMIVNFWFNEQLVPQCDAEAEVLIQKLDDPSYERRMYDMLQYRSPDKSRDWLFMSFNATGAQGSVILKQYKVDPSGKKRILRWDIRADEARWTPGGWEFRGVRKTNYHELLHIPGAPKEYGVLRISSSEITENLENIRNAVRPPEELSSMDIWRTLRTNPNMAPILKSTYKTLLYYRMAFPWICFLCVFLGLPLAVKNERSGIFLSIVTAVVAIVLFQMMTEVFLVLGKQGFLPPIIGGLGPTVAFLLYSYFGVFRKSC